jgi:hypothetical protein
MRTEYWSLIIRYAPESLIAAFAIFPQWAPYASMHGQQAIS